MGLWAIAVVAFCVLLNQSESKFPRAVNEGDGEAEFRGLQDLHEANDNAHGWRSGTFDQMMEWNTDNVQRDRRQAELEELNRESRRAQQDESRCGCEIRLNWNPVCGSNGKTYDNMEHLECVQRCGINVRKRHMGTCRTQG